MAVPKCNRYRIQIQTPRRLSPISTIARPRFQPGRNSYVSNILSKLDVRDRTRAVLGRSNSVTYEGRRIRPSETARHARWSC